MDSRCDALLVENLRIVHTVISVIGYDNRVLDLHPQADGTIRVEVSTSDVFVLGAGDSILIDAKNIELFVDSAQRVRRALGGTVTDIDETWNILSYFACRFRRKLPVPFKDRKKYTIDERVIALIEDLRIQE